MRIANMLIEDRTVMEYKSAAPNVGGSLRTIGRLSRHVRFIEGPRGLAVPIRPPGHLYFRLDTTEGKVYVCVRGSENAVRYWFDHLMNNTTAIEVTRIFNDWEW